MYLAVHDELPPSTIALLQQHGAQPVESVRGELFGKAAVTQELVEERRAEQKQKIEAEQAADTMKNNMKLLQQRGEQINEMGDKASDMVEGAANFAEMAKKLKESQKNKKWYQL